MSSKTRAQWEEYIRGKYPHNPAFQAPVVERHTSHEPVEAKGFKGLDSPCRIHLHSKRHRLIDLDNLSCKAVLDGLRLAGFLKDDGPGEVVAVTQSQEKISNKEDEQTEIIIEEA